MFTLAISCLTTSSLPWFMDLTFQFPMQYCSLQHQTWLPSPVTSTTWRCFCFGSISSFFLELFLHLSPVAHWVPTELGGGVHLSVSYLFAFSCCSWGSQGKNTEVVCLSLLLSELNTMTCLSWVVLHGMAHSFIKLDKAMVHVIRLVRFLWLWFLPVCPLMPSLSTYHLTVVSLSLDVGYLLLAPAPDLGCGVTPLSTSMLHSQ